MKCIILFLFMLCASTFGYANSKQILSSINDGNEVTITYLSNQNEGDRGESIRAYISGRSLTVVIPCELGQVSVEITNDRGDIVHCLSVQTPTGYQLMIPSEGSYVVTFTLQDGSVYYGEFDVE
ncbi:MAG: hypothetical protein ACI35Y_01355 [Candidatus Limimorpha sp.]